MSETATLGLREAASEFLERLAAYGQALRVYGSRHPRVEVARQRLEQARRALAGELPRERPNLSFILDQGDFYLENVPLPETGHRVPLLRETLELRGQAGFCIRSDASDRDLETAAGALAKRGREADGGEFEAEGFSWIAAEEARRLQSSSDEPVGDFRANWLPRVARIEVDTRLYDEALERVAAFRQEIRSAGRPGARDLRDIARRLVARLRDGEEELLPLVTLPYFLDFPVCHAVNVCLLATAAARRLTGDAGRLEEIALAALLADSGMAEVPPDLLGSAAAIDEGEREQLRAHVASGCTSLMMLPDVGLLAVIVAWGHHTRDGEGGYPKGSLTTAARGLTRLVAVADAYEALTAWRPWRRPATSPAAFSILWRDPAFASWRPWVDLLASAVGFHPVGSRVRSNGGLPGVVRGHRDGDPRRPIVALVESGGSSVIPLGPERDASPTDLPVRAPEDSRGIEVAALDPLEDVDLLVAH